MTLNEFLKQKSHTEGTKTASELQDILKTLAKDDAINVIPADDPCAGSIGFSIWKETEEGEDSFLLMINVADAVEKIKVETKEEFIRLFDEAWVADIPIDRCDDPVKALVGFIVSRRSRRILYQLQVSNLKDL